VSQIKKLIKIIILFRAYQRTRIVWSYYKRNFHFARSWIFARTEMDNFYYHLQNENIADLGCAVSIATNAPLLQINRYCAEILNNVEILEIIRKHWDSDAQMRDSIVGLGRRIGWYATIRAIKPTLVVETGVSHGVGALVICAALEANRLDGFPGKYIGTDIDPKAGVLLTEKFKKFGKVIVGDSLTTLSELHEEVGVFINDSDHSHDYEAAEYEVINKILSDRSIILGDNSHVSSALRVFAIKSNRQYLFFKEFPSEHWYPGAGIGFAFNAAVGI